MKISKTVINRIAVAGICVLALAIGGLLNYIYTVYTAEYLRNHPEVEQNIHTGSSLFSSAFTDNQLVQKLLDAMAPGADVLAVYESVPLYQLNGISYEEFYRYTGLYKSFLQNKADTYSRMNISDREAIQRRMVNHSNDLRQVALNSSYYWLENSADSGEQGRIPILIQKNIQGEAYLSREWVSRSLDLYDYGELYFSVLENGTAEELGEFLPGDSRSKDVLTEKGALLKERYSDAGFDFSVRPQVEQFRMDEIGYSQEMLVGSGSPSGSQTNSRKMSIISPERDRFLVDDYVICELKEKDKSVYFGSAKLFTVGEYVLGKDVNAAFRTPPRNIIRHELPDWISYTIDPNANLLDVRYGRLTLQVIGYYNEQSGEWEGVVRSASLYKEGVRTGSDIEIGAPVEAALVEYPFMDQTNYSVFADNIELYIGRRDQHIVSITIIDHSYTKRSKN